MSNEARVTPAAASRPHWSALDGLRGIAILLVVTLHFYSHSAPSGNGFPVVLQAGEYCMPMAWFFHAGAYGVPIFFALSGFLLWYPFAKAIHLRASLPSAAKFYRRRAFRIMPAYLFFTCIFWLASALFGMNSHGAPATPLNISANLVFLTPVAALFNRDAVTLDFVPGSWSLTPEMWFYAVLPLLAILARRRWLHIVVLAAMLVGGGVVRHLAEGDPRSILPLNLLGCMHAFAWGMVAAELDLRAVKFFRRPMVAYLGLGLLCLAAFPQRFLIGLADPYTEVGLASALMMVSLTSTPTALKAVCDTPFLRFMGKISYSLFLCHVTMVWYVFDAVFERMRVSPGPNRFALLMTAGLACCTLISWITYEWIERPWLEARRKPLPPAPLPPLASERKGEGRLVG